MAQYVFNDVNSHRSGFTHPHPPHTTPTLSSSPPHYHRLSSTSICSGHYSTASLITALASTLPTPVISSSFPRPCVPSPLSPPRDSLLVRDKVQ
ncbi:hypothetical protein E2C01_026451 [Portunus trituberculatus]|uniref:Uncharacterized protein n=1 Tax=Portunus trituberculatus TaxID=210409 RepID=A0A5B7EIW6_PORTR|nr:hypothetical protein [Portunus trituberculatus]